MLIVAKIINEKEGRTGKVVPLFKWLLYVLPPHVPGEAGLLASLDAKDKREEDMAEDVEKPRRTEQVKAYVTPEEFTLIMESSERAGLSLSEFARRVCLGFRVESREDQQARRELLKVNANLEGWAACSSKPLWPGTRSGFMDCSTRLTRRRLF